ncbi:MAG TPA: PA2169 family four-helix-bundle protein [Allosphingosinicella sp.]|nr:PA2169 family four-helix-bundle protein [Allosphingosinicella sp.]
MFDQSHDISVLNSLIETTIDSVDGYRHSANEATNQRFSESFRNWAQDREQVVTKLRDRVRALGGTPEHDGGILAAMHRQFLSLRDKVTGSDDQSVIAEVDRGESYLDDKWQTALNDNELSPETRETIQSCYGSVREGRMQWEQLNRSLSAAT